MKFITIGILAFAALAHAQTTTAPRRSITASGNATVSITPDKALVDVGVVTQAATAQDASSQNATQATAVRNAIQSVLGPNATIQTVSYSVTPVYNNAQAGQTPTIVGYLVTNVVEATLTDLSLIGKVIDASIAAGANRVQGIQFGLQNPDSVQTQALKAAAASALTQAKAIASGLGVSTGSVIHAAQGFNISYPTLALGAAKVDTPTPIEPGMIKVSATVTIEVEITG